MQQQRQQQMLSKVATPRSMYGKENHGSYTQRSQKRITWIKNQSTAYTTLHSPRCLEPPRPSIHHTGAYHYQIHQLPQTKQKHGEGVLMMHDGTCVIGTWKKGLLNGRTLIFTPFGGRVIVEYLNGKMNGWCVGRFGAKTVVITHYFQGKIDGERVVYDGIEELWVASHYTPEGKFLAMVQVETGKMQKLPSFVSYEGLEDFYQQVLANQLDTTFTKLKHLHIDLNTQYIGFCSEDCVPEGLGVTFSDYQVFLGIYHHGALNKMARMFFRSGEIYQGGVSDGCMSNIGLMYSPISNVTTVIKTFNQESESIERIQGYFLIDFQYRVGKRSKEENRIGFMLQGVKQLSQLLSKYYYSYFIDRKKSEQNNMSRKSNPSIQKRNIQEISSQLKWLPPDFEGLSEEQKANKYELSEKDQYQIHSQEELFSRFQDSPISPRNMKQQANISAFQTLRIEQNSARKQIEDYSKKKPKSPLKKKMMPEKSVTNLSEYHHQSRPFGHYSEGMKFGLRKQSADKKIFKKKNQIEQESENYSNHSQVSNLTNKFSQLMKKNTRKQKIFTNL